MSTRIASPHSLCCLLLQNLKHRSSGRWAVLADGALHIEVYLSMRDVQDCQQRLNSAFDLLLLFLRSLIQTLTLTLTPPPNNALLANLDLYTNYLSNLTFCPQNTLPPKCPTFEELYLKALQNKYNFISLSHWLLLNHLKRVCMRIYVHIIVNFLVCFHWMNACLLTWYPLLSWCQVLWQVY